MERNLKLTRMTGTTALEGERPAAPAVPDDTLHRGQVESRNTSMLSQLGGAARLWAIINRFVDRTFSDVMIGYMFRGVSRDRVKRKEYEFAAEHLGGDGVYTGRPIGQAHARHRIEVGQFHRRLQLLTETLQEFEVPPDVQIHWLEHTRGLMPTVVVTAEACGATPALTSEEATRDEGSTGSEP